MWTDGGGKPGTYLICALNDVKSFKENINQFYYGVFRFSDILNSFYLYILRPSYNF